MAAIEQSGDNNSSSIGETCHQCRHKISGSAASCKNQRSNKPCSIKLCRKCLLDRYGEKAEEVAAFQGWCCPKCRGICNCIVCMQKKGHQPTAVLTYTTKATGFSTVTEMLLKRVNYLNKERIAACMDAPLKGKHDVVLPRKRGKGISIDGKVDSVQNPKKTKHDKSYEMSNGKNNNKRNLRETS
ncbi:cell division cycle-associated protein 7 [Phtheirospermum japonicum]|uniref:Cell division cycle-associated protein 7 n=1 Tax=Phtheirospermum japonicum TaxID=374723 RepID=A0A830BGE7_9LAMI|nr:cell division cycle-associated protein 7 [Phtheirospermum japonicum]